MVKSIYPLTGVGELVLSRLEGTAVKTDDLSSNSDRSKRQNVEPSELICMTVLCIDVRNAQFNHTEKYYRALDFERRIVTLRRAPIGFEVICDVQCIGDAVQKNWLEAACWIAKLVWPTNPATIRDKSSWARSRESNSC